METVEVANKELKVETRLRNIENCWEKDQLGFIRHRDTEVLYKSVQRLGGVFTIFPGQLCHSRRLIFFLRFPTSSVYGCAREGNNC